MLRGIYTEVREIYMSGNHIETGSYFTTAYGTLILKESSCAGVTKAVGLCLYILGIPYEHINEGKWQHQWARVWSEKLNKHIIMDSQGGIFGEEITYAANGFLTEIENEMMRLLGEARRENNSSLDYVQSADWKVLSDRLAKHMADNKFGWDYSIATAAVFWQYGGEVTGETAEKIMNQWLGLPGNRRNLLCDMVTHVSVSVYRSGHTITAAFVVESREQINDRRWVGTCYNCDNKNGTSPTDKERMEIFFNGGWKDNTHHFKTCCI